MGAGSLCWGHRDSSSADPGGWSQAMQGYLPSWARQLLGQGRREGGVPGPRSRGGRESAQGRPHAGKGGLGVGPSPGGHRHPVSLGSPGLCRRHPKAWLCLVGSRVGPQLSRFRSGWARSSPSCLVAAGEGRLPVTSSPGACARMSHALGPPPSSPSAALRALAGSQLSARPFCRPPCRLLVSAADSRLQANSSPRLGLTPSTAWFCPRPACGIRPPACLT